MKYNNKRFLTGILIFLFVAFVLFMTTSGNIGIYNGIHKGIYFLNCGFEFFGDFGFFCGNY